MTDHTDELIALAKKCGAEVLPISGTQCDSKTITFTDMSILAFAGLLRQQDMARLARMREALEHLSCIWDEEYPDKFIEECKAALSETSDIQDGMDGQRAQWQPIETAPKDGTGIIAYWTPVVSGGASAVGFAAFNGSMWMCEGEEVNSPNYWLPLPAAPSARSTKGEG